MNIKFALNTQMLFIFSIPRIITSIRVFFFKFTADVIVSGGIDAGAGAGWKFMQTQYEIQHCN